MTGLMLALAIGGWHWQQGTSPDYAVAPRGDRGVVVRRVAARTTYVGRYGDRGFAVGIVGAAPFRGTRVTVTQRAGRTEGSGFAEVYVNVWGPEGLLTGDNSRTHHRDPGPQAADYSFVLDIPPDATSIEVGITLSGGGEAFVDRAEIEAAAPDAVPTGRPLVKPIDAASRHRVTTALLAVAQRFTPDHEQALRAVARAAGNARIIGIGQTAHGSAAEDARSAEIVRHLMLHDGLRVLVAEVMFGTGRRLDAYVNGEHVDVDRALRETSFYAFETVEFRRLLDWMRAENASRPAERRLHVAGADMQYWWRQSDFIVERLRRLDRSAARTAQRRYACIDHAVAADAAACLRDVRAVSALVRGSFGARGIEEAHAARMVEQHLEKLLGTATRDDAIAENVAWAAQMRYPGTRIAFWAHLYHVGDACCLGHVTAGRRLAVRFGDGYYALGLVFGSGTVRAIPDGGTVPSEIAMPAPSPNTLEAVLDAVGDDYFVDTLAGGFDESAASWLKLPHRLRRIDLWTDTLRPETSWTDERLWNTVDGFIYLRTTTAPELIPGAIKRASTASPPQAFTPTA